MPHIKTLVHGSFPLTIQNLSQPVSGWNEIEALTYVNTTDWRTQLGVLGLAEGQPFTLEVPAGGQMFVYEHAPRRAPGGYEVTVRARGSLEPLVNGEARRWMEQYEGGVESVVVEPANVAFVKSTKTMWAYDGTDWFDTGQGGSPSPGMLTVAAEGGLPSSIIVSHKGENMSASVTIGNSVRFSIPRVSVIYTYIADRLRFDPTSAESGMTNVSAGTGSVIPRGSGQLIGGTEPAPADLPDVLQYVAPSQLTAIVVPWGWVLTSRVAQPAARGVTDLHLVTDTLTWFQTSEFN